LQKRNSTHVSFCGALINRIKFRMRTVYSSIIVFDSLPQCKFSS